MVGCLVGKKATVERLELVPIYCWLSAPVLAFAEVKQAKN